MNLNVRALLEAVQTRVGKTISAATREKLTGAITRLSDASGSIDEAAAAIGALLEEVDAESETARAVRAELGEQGSVEGVRQLRTQAKAGAAYLERLIEETVKARVAVQGDAFDAERYTARLQRFDVEDIEDEHLAWTGKRAQLFQPGRQVPPQDPNAQNGQNGEHAGVRYEDAE